jgi:hypothetical protein
MQSCIRQECTHVAHVSLQHACIRQHTSAYACIRQHTYAELHTPRAHARCARLSPARLHTSAYVSIRLHTSAYVSIRLHTSAYVSIRQHTPAYVSIRQHLQHAGY